MNLVISVFAFIFFVNVSPVISAVPQKAGVKNVVVKKASTTKKPLQKLEGNQNTDGLVDDLPNVIKTVESYKKELDEINKGLEKIKKENETIKKSESVEIKSSNFDTGFKKADSSSTVIVSTTPVVKIVSLKKAWFSKHAEVSIGLDLELFRDVTSDVPNGFTIDSSDQKGSCGKMFVQIKINRWALYWSPKKDASRLDYEYNGTSLGKMEVTNYKTPVLKHYLLDKPDYSAYIGFGGVYTKINNEVSMGSFKFPATVSKWSALGVLGGQCSITKWLAVGADYTKMNVRTSIAIPFISKLRTVDTGGLSVWLSLRK